MTSESAQFREHRDGSSARGLAARLARVSKRYANGVVALDRLTLDVAEGEFLSLLGPSGCGKSTALRLLAGLSKPSSGAVELFGDARGSSVGFVFQDATLLPWASVFDNVSMPLRLWRKSKAEIAAEVGRVLDMVGLGRFHAAYPHELSGGMRMRVSIARALATRPRLLLMDEPFAALDEITRAKLDDDLTDIYRRSGCTVVFVTHSAAESVYLSTRIAVMAARPGRLIGDFAVDAPFPRGRAHRLSPAFAEAVRAASDLLDRASGRLNESGLASPNHRPVGSDEP